MNSNLHESHQFHKFLMAFDRALEQIKGEVDIIQAVKEQTYEESRRTFFTRIQEIVLADIGDNEELLNFYMDHSELKNEKLNECMDLFIDCINQKDGEN